MLTKIKYNNKIGLRVKKLICNSYVRCQHRRGAYICGCDYYLQIS